MTTPFDHGDYRDFLKSRLQSMPSNGHGQLTKIARTLRVHPTLMTQILKGSKNLTLEQGLLVSEYLGLTENEIEFFLGLIESERAGHFKLKRRIEVRLQRLKAQNLKPQARVPKHQVLSSADRAHFYSNWYYSAVRLLVGIAGFQSVEPIAEHLGLERRIVNEVLEFLLKTGLVVKSGERLKPGTKRTYLPPDSPLVSRHHTNWRLKAIESFPKISDEEIAFTAPLSISKKDFPKAKKILLGAIEQISKLVDDSEEEIVACLNMDFFRIGKD